MNWNVIIFSLSVGFLLIGLHLTFVLGNIASGYPAFMLCSFLLLWYQLRKANTKQGLDTPEKPIQKIPKKKKK